MKTTRVKTMLSAALLALMGASTMASAKEWNTIRIGIDPTYPPFESIAKDGTVVGFDVDLGNALCEKLKAKCVWVQSSFDGLIPGLQARKFDVILSSMAANAKRREQIDFTDRLYRNQTRLIAKDSAHLLPEASKLVVRYPYEDWRQLERPGLGLPALLSILVIDIGNGRPADLGREVADAAE